MNETIVDVRIPDIPKHILDRLRADALANGVPDSNVSVVRFALAQRARHLENQNSPEPATTAASN